MFLHKIEVYRHLYTEELRERTPSYKITYIKHLLHGYTCKFTSNSYFLLSTPCKASNITYLLC